MDNGPRLFLFEKSKSMEEGSMMDDGQRALELTTNYCCYQLKQQQHIWEKIHIPHEWCVINYNDNDNESRE